MAEGKKLETTDGADWPPPEGGRVFVFCDADLEEALEQYREELSAARVNVGQAGYEIHAIRTFFNSNTVLGSKMIMHRKKDKEGGAGDG